MANYNINAVTNSASSALLIGTDKVRIAATTNIYVISGNSSIAAANTSPIVLASSIERSFYVGAGNYISVLAVSANGMCSVTELGSPGTL
jgi:hypothetical protein